jgi:hypothetical protein
MCGRRMARKGSVVSEWKKYLITTRKGSEVISGIKGDLSENIAVIVCYLETFRQALNHEIFPSVEIVSATTHKLNTPPHPRLVPYFYLGNSLLT